MALFDGTRAAPTDDVVEFVSLTNKTGSTGTQFNIVKADTGSDNGFLNAAVNEAYPIGVLLDTPANNSTGKIGFRGATTCNASDATISESRDRSVGGQLVRRKASRTTTLLRRDPHTAREGTLYGRPRSWCLSGQLRKVFFAGPVSSGCATGPVWLRG
jgi:hypothetical protein